MRPPIANRVAWCIAAIARFHRTDYLKNHDDAGQIAALACLVHEDNAAAVRMAKRTFRQMIDYRRPKMASIASMSIPDRSHVGTEKDCTLARLWPVLNRLHPRHREAIVRVEVDEVSRQAVADELGVTVGDLGQMIRTARKQLRRYCEMEGIRP